MVHRLAGLLLVGLLAGCAAHPSPVALPSKDSVAEPVKPERFHLDGQLATSACLVPNPRGCSGPLVNVGNEGLELSLEHNVTSIEVTLKWTAKTPASQNLHLGVYCGEQGCPFQPVGLDGPSPLQGRLVGNFPGGDLRLFVHSTNLYEQAGAFGMIEDGTPFSLDAVVNSA
jgi:hypothetical protein